MRRPETLKYLFDIAEACRLLDEFVTGKTFADYQADALLRSAVERQLKSSARRFAWPFETTRHLPGR
jgi:uncharacterized protein with HEPN domain